MRSTRVRRLRRERVSPTVVLQAIIKEFARDPTTVFCCFEGKDIGYYGVRARSALDGFSLAIYNCNGKESLIALYLSVRDNISITHGRFLFFVDRDYDFGIDGLPTDLCFITDGYSIENYYTSIDAFTRIIRTAFFNDQLYEATDIDCVETLIARYREVLDRFHAVIRLFLICGPGRRGTSRARVKDP